MPPKTKKIAVAGSGRLAGSKLVADLIFKSLRRLQPEAVVVLPGHIAFNALVRVQAARLSLPVEQIQPPRPFWVGPCLQSYRKRLVRGFYAKAVSGDVEVALVFKRQASPGTSFEQLVDQASEAVVFTLKPSGEELLSTDPLRRLAALERSPGR